MYKLPDQIADEFLRITAPWKQQYISINESLGTQYEKYKEADADSETAVLLGTEMLETISFAIPQCQKDIAQERDIFSQSSTSNLLTKHSELTKIGTHFESWARDTYPKIVEKFLESTVSLKTDTEERLRVRLSSEERGDILAPLIGVLEADKQKSQGDRLSPQSLVATLEKDCGEKCEVVSREILESYLEEFNSIAGDTFEEITTSLGVEFASISHDKEQNAPNQNSASLSANLEYYGDNLWFNAFKKMLPASGAAAAVGSVVAIKAIVGGGLLGGVVIGIASLTGIGLVVAGIGAAAIGVSRFLKGRNVHSKIQEGLVSYVEEFRNKTIQNFSEFHKGVVANTESLLENVLKEMRAKQASGFSAISEANNMSQEQKDQKVAALDATSKQLRELSGKIEECLARGVTNDS